MEFFFGLRPKFILLSFLCITLTAFLTSYSIIKHERALLEKNVRQQGLTLAKSSAILFTNAFIYEELGMLDASGMADYLDYYVSDVMRMDPRILFFVVLDAGGRVVTHNDLREYGTSYESKGIREMLAQDASYNVRYLEDKKGKKLEISMPLAIGSKRWGVCQILFSLKDIDIAMDELRKEVAQITAIGFLLSLIIIGITAEYCVRPLHKLSQAMQRITTKGDLFLPIPKLPNRHDETGQLLQGFKWMIHRLQQVEKERVRAMKMMFHTEKMATIGQLTSSIVHEVNNPLGGVVLCFRNLTQGNLEEEGKKQHIEAIHSSLEHIQKIMRDLLDYSRQSSLSMTPNSLESVVEKSVLLVDALLRRQNIVLRIEKPQTMPHILFDAIKIQQVLINLLLNAIYVMPHEGRLTITLSADEEHCAVTVSDTGPGVPEELRDKIFDPFFTTKEAGKATGLGLALSKSIVEQHGGRLILARSSDKGSAFSLYLPLAEENSHE